MLVFATFRSQAYYNSAGWRATWAGEGGGDVRLKELARAGQVPAGPAVNRQGQASALRQRLDTGLDDGRKLRLRGSNDVDDDNRGILVEDPRYGRVEISWDDFERLEFGDGSIFRHQVFSGHRSHLLRGDAL